MIETIPARHLPPDSGLAAVPGRVGRRAGVYAAIGGKVLPAIVILSMPLATVLIAIAYADAANGDPGQTHFDLFWLGVLLFLIPASLRLFGQAASRAERLALLAVLGVLNFLPKFLTTPDHFLYHDELAHWRQAELIFSSGQLFLPNPTVYISQFFPGLESMTVALRAMTGLTTFQVAAVLILCTHIAALIGMFVIGETLTGSARVGGVVALLYSLNPGFMYFDSQYSYESVAFVLVIWVIAAVVKMHAATERRARGTWFVTGLLLAATCIVTHHVSSYMVIGILWLITTTSWIGVAMRRASRGSAVLLTCFTGIVTLAGLGWLLVVAPAIIPYLTQPFSAALHQLSQILHHRQASRTLFAHGLNPAYERYAAYGSIVIAGLGALGGWLAVRKGALRSPTAIGLALFGTVYFASMPLMLTVAGNEGARRTWTFTYIGLCVLVAPAVVALLRWTEGRRLLRRILVAGGLAGLICVVQVGNVSMNSNEYYRFPGPYVFGSDTRSTTTELLKMTSWLRASQGTDQAVVADYYASEIISSFGLEWTPLAALTFPVWQLYFDPTPPNPALLHLLEISQYSYVVVDERMARYLPYLGAYFADGEAGPHGVKLSKPPPASVIDRFARMPWTIRIYQSNNLSIYRLNYAALPLAWHPLGASVGRP